jgi:hypothetical protein
MRKREETSTEAKSFQRHWVVSRPLESASEIDRTRLIDGWQDSQPRATGYGAVDTDVLQVAVGHGRKRDRGRCGVQY